MTSRADIAGERRPASLGSIELADNRFAIYFAVSNDPDWNLLLECQYLNVVFTQFVEQISIIRRTEWSIKSN